MPMSGEKKSPLISVPFLKKRLRRITGLGLYNLTVNEYNFTVHFTLHRNEKTVAFYTSDLIENQRSPEWSYFKFPESVQCLQEFLMRVWITSLNQTRLVLEYDIHLDNSLIPGEQDDNGNNSLWLEMFGYRFTDHDVPLNDEEILTIDKKKRFPPVKSYNKLSIIRMNNVIHAICAEKQASAVYLQRLQTFFDANEDYLSKIKERELRRLRVASLKQYLHLQTYRYQKRLIAHQQKQKTIEERKNQLNHNLSQIIIQQEQIHLYTNYLDQSKTILRNLTQIITYRQKEIMTEIYNYIYPIQMEKQNEYSIANIKLPQADDKIYQSASNRDRDNEIAAAVGYCSHFLLIISQVIHLPLRFPIDCHGMSAIKIYDYSLETTEFPLYPTSNLSSFRYGLYLLNRDIGQIMYHCRIGDRNRDYRNTLENLKFLIEHYFINSNNNLSIQSVKIPNKRDSTASSLFLTSSFSSTSSLTESNDYEQNEDIELLPQFKPRLLMQISHPLQN